jgi:chemotaxis protein MotB
MKNQPVIVVKKRKGGHGAAHGGAWKVAYADFVTAMMAFFLVMWIVGQSAQVRAAVAGYFRNPGLFDYEKSNSMVPGGEKGVLPEPKAGTPNESPAVQDAARLEAAAARIRKALGSVPEFSSLKDQIEIKMTAEGLRIELMESASGTFFESGSPAPTQNGREMLVALAQEVGKLPNQISFEGHTDAKPFARDSNYGNWELSVDRANAARRLMQQNGIKENQVAQVRGYADQQLRKPGSPEDPSNRRISLIIQYIVKDQSGSPQTDKQSGDIKGPESKDPEK